MSEQRERYKPKSSSGSSPLRYNTPLSIRDNKWWETKHNVHIDRNGAVDVQYEVTPAGKARLEAWWQKEMKRLRKTHAHNL